MGGSSFEKAAAFPGHQHLGTHSCRVFRQDRRWRGTLRSWASSRRSPPLALRRRACLSTEFRSRARGSSGDFARLGVVRNSQLWRSGEINQDAFGCKGPPKRRATPKLFALEHPSTFGGGHQEGDFSKPNLDEPLIESLKTAKSGPSKLLKKINRANVLAFCQLSASVLFVVLYVWGTYSAPAPGGWRYWLENGLCLFFALDYAARLVQSDDPLREACSVGNVLDFLSFAPFLIEAILGMLSLQNTLLDFSWIRIFRAMRVLRLSVITVNLSDMQNLSSSAVVDGAIRVRLTQLFASIIVVIFTAASVIHLFEKMPWHVALYFVVTTLTTVGYGDVVVESAVGKVIVVAMMISAVMVIPVRATRMYQQATTRRIRRGSLPGPKNPFVLVFIKLSDVRGFSDFYKEFSSHLTQFQSPLSVKRFKMVCVTNRPEFEFRVFQEMNDSGLSLIEGSAFSENDLIQCQAHKAQALLLLADRFSGEEEEEDLMVLFQAWAVKSYTKSVPLFVQVLKSASVPQISQFLDPVQDIIISLEQVRHRLLVLSCLCPGAATLLGNLLRIAKLSEVKSKEETILGRKWRRAYVNSCGNGVFEARAGPSFFGMEFLRMAEAVSRLTGMMPIGLVDGKGKLSLNPGQRPVRSSDRIVLIAMSQKEANDLEQVIYYPPSPYLQHQREELLESYSIDGGSADFPCPVDFFPEDELITAECRGLWQEAASDGEKPPHELEWQSELGSSPRNGAQGAKLVKGSEVESIEQSTSLQVEVSGLDGIRDHVIVSGAPDSFLPFVKELRRCCARPIPVVILHEDKEDAGVRSVLQMSSVYFAKGSSSTQSGLIAAKATESRCFMHLCQSQRPSVSSKPEAVLTDAKALLTSYNIGAEGFHAVVELCFTSAINFLQPGMLLKGSLVVDDVPGTQQSPSKSWQVRRKHMKAARDEGLTEWQTNPYYSAGRVLVPALLDTLACHSFFSKGLLIDLMAEFTGDVNSGNYVGPLLKQISLPNGFKGKTYTELVSYLVLQRGLIPLGLFRRKSENRSWLLRYVCANPPGEVVLEGTDKVFVIRERT
ncbi:hypothetical protein BSKO_13447 [Bryopsis sp. KO-2023]|nr:hypothetical protein BSKO_13447 [Bryopsis sp. KO-2023]